MAGLPAGALAQNVPLTQDAYVVPGNGANYGTITMMNVGGSTENQGLIQFDLSTLPPGTTRANIARATLVVFASKVGVPGTINISVATGAWTEYAVNGLNAPTAGAVVASGVPVSGEGYIHVDATAAVQGWLDGIPNDGFLLTPLSAGVSAAFDTKENTLTSHPASLTIMLSASGTGGATGPTGPTGPIGPAGPVGSQGPAGPIGATGAAGAAGPAGPIGATGAAGAAGPAGPAGVAGSAGPAGPQGPPGPGGTSHYIFRAINQNGVPGANFSLPLSNPPVENSFEGTNSGNPSVGSAAWNYGTLSFAANSSSATAQSAEGAIYFPSTWNAASGLTINGAWLTTSTGGSVVWQIQGQCVGAGAAPGNFGGPVALAPSAADANAGNWTQLAPLALTTSDALAGCRPGSLFLFRFFRDHQNVSDTLSDAAQLVYLDFGAVE